MGQAQSSYDMTPKEALVEAASKASIPTAVSTGAMAGLGLNEWVYIFTLVYLFLQIVDLITKLLGIARGKAEKASQDGSK